ncbi:MAG: pyrimidine 5'-nucleotidase [Hyphomicrobiaceae bacterium]|nr:MAG: pyrimidine 5'-nucleotidase [Hyphomicrobiaceae bacterium]
MAEMARKAITSRALGHVREWVFDLDNTLYPAACNLFLEIDRRMGEFISAMLEIPYEEARYLQKHYYRQFGTTLRGLMTVHAIDPKPFLDYVHDIDLARVEACPGLDEALARLPGRKIIFTNGTRRHAERVAGKLGILDRFEAIFDIADSAFIPKPGPKPYAMMLEAHGLNPCAAAMFEDMPQNLKEPHALGMATVLVTSPAFDHPVQREIEGWRNPPHYVHHVTENLTEFLADLTGKMATPAG